MEKAWEWDYTLCALCILNLPLQVLIDSTTTIIVLLYCVLSPRIVRPHTQFMDFVKKLASGELKVDDGNVGGKQTSSSGLVPGSSPAVLLHTVFH